MNRNTIIAKIFSKQSKRKQRKLKNYLNVLEILNDMECYERYNWKIKDKIEKSSA